jgi:hypothetical protein
MYTFCLIIAIKPRRISIVHADPIGTSPKPRRSPCRGQHGESARGIFRARRNLAKVRLARALPNSCSQIRITCHPADRSTRFTCRSRARFLAILATQYLRLLAGSRARVRWPCQKAPSTNTATFCVRNTKSGRPGSRAWRRHPAIFATRNNATSRNSVDRLPRPRIAAMTAERFALVKTSATAEQMRRLAFQSNVHSQ